MQKTELEYFDCNVCGKPLCGVKKIIARMNDKEKETVKKCLECRWPIFEKETERDVDEWIAEVRREAKSGGFFKRIIKNFMSA